jgi:hypothetical protein
LVVARLRCSVLSTVPSPTPKTVSDTDPVVASLVGFSIVWFVPFVGVITSTSAEWKDIPSVIDPALVPIVIANFNVVIILLGVLHRTDVMLTHSVASQEV